MSLWLLASLLHCTPTVEDPVATAQPTLPPKPYHQTDLVLDEPRPVAGTNATAVLREPSPGTWGLRVVVTWPDGTIDDHEGQMPVIFDSHGYRFALEGLRHMASLEVEPIPQ